jgi:hypothetical protein
MKARRAWLLVGLAGLALGAVLTAAGSAYLRLAAQVPEYTPPPVELPSPNAYDDYVEATRVLSQTSRLQPKYDGTMTLAELRELAADSRPALQRLRQGFRHDYLTPPVYSFSAQFPELSRYRELARRLAAEGELARREGRLEGAADAYLDGLRVGTDVPRGGPLIHGLVGVAIQGIVLKPLEESVERLDARTAARTARRMAELDAAAPRVADSVAAERDFAAAGLVEMFAASRGSWKELTELLQGGAGGPGSFSLDAVAHGAWFAVTPKGQMLDNYLSYMDQVTARAGRPYYDAGPPLRVPKDPVSQFVLPVFEGTVFRWSVRDAQWRIIQTRLAARAYQLDYGRPPASLEALVPKYLPAVPQDPFAPQPLVYRVQDGKPLVYSVGPDGADDGGTDLGSRVEANSTGDIVTMQRK